MRRHRRSFSRILAGSSRTFYSTVALASLLMAAGSFSVLNSQTGGMSRPMEQAIRLYELGEDNEAMDRFMDILMNGTPSEKAVANDYISRITTRMTSGASMISERPSMDETPPIPAAPPKVVPVPRPARMEEPEYEEGPEEAEPAERQEIIPRMIDKKISSLRRDLLHRLNKLDAIKVYVGDSLPKAVTLDPKYFFASDTVFKSGAAQALADLAGLMYTMGKATLTILPEGTVGGDVKIKGIRQAIALNSYMVSRGLSQSRIDVNLTKTDIKFPRELTSISGIILLFDHEKSPKLTEPEGVRPEAPRVSLGVYPTSLSVAEDEGSIVEFSVFEAASGNVSWRFEVLSLREDNTLVPLQKVEGEGALCRQTYWNGRKSFFGDPYPPGKYMFSISASDEQGRESDLRRFLLIKRDPGSVKAEPAPGKAGARSSATPTAVIRKGVPIKSPKIKKPPLKKIRRPAVRAGRAAAKPDKPAAAPAVNSPAGPEENIPEQTAARTKSSGVTYRIVFEEGTAAAEEGGDKQLAKVAENMSYYPMAQIKLIGYAHTGEPDPLGLARRRVEHVASRLSDKYNINSDRMESSTQVSENGRSMVEIKMRGNE